MNMTTNRPHPNGRRVLRLRDTVRITGYSNMQLWRLEKAGTFPRRIKLNPDGGPHGAAGHDYGEVMAWLDARLASRTHPDDAA